MDFYFAGYRMPDLIRYKKYYSVNLWPTGTIGGYGVDRNGAPPATTPPWNYGNVECLADRSGPRSSPTRTFPSRDGHEC